MNYLTSTAVALVAALAAGSAAMAQEHHFRFQSSDPAGNPNFELQHVFADKVKELTNGEVTIGSSCRSAPSSTTRRRPTPSRPG